MDSNHDKVIQSHFTRQERQRFSVPRTNFHAKTSNDSKREPASLVWRRAYCLRASSQGNRPKKWKAILLGLHGSSCPRVISSVAARSSNPFELERPMKYFALLLVALSLEAHAATQGADRTITWREWW